MNYGVASLAILTALEELGSGRLVTIDPFQSVVWRNAGRLAVKQAGLDHRHEMIERPSHLGLPALVDRRLSADFAYVDGWRTFDGVLLDFLFVDQLLEPGGVVAFNDCDFPSVDLVIRFIQTHRRYRELDVSGISSQPAWASARVDHDRYFCKLEHWEPQNFYEEF
jgi:predicted O-methyltransferase YrrM